MERDTILFITKALFHISTHTLTWSVTISTFSHVFSHFISTHTLTWSVTAVDYRCLTYAVYFNSHAHVERDSLACICRELSKISTHTLTWSVTKFGEILSRHAAISTHTLTWSVTENCCHATNIYAISTHTLTWSVTFESYSHSRKGLDFNSHAHVERDAFLACPIAVIIISTHTLTWSVTNINRL